MSIMTMVNSYFDQIVEPMFQRDEQGRDVFFPIGMGTRGRIIPDPASAQNLKLRLRRGWMAFFFIWIPFTSIFATYIPNLWAFLGMLAVSMMIVWGFSLYLARGLEMSERRMTLRNQNQSITAMYSLRRLIVMVVLSAALTAMSASAFLLPALSSDQPSWFKPVSGAGAVFFAACTLMWLWSAVAKWRKG